MSNYCKPHKFHPGPDEACPYCLCDRAFQELRSASAENTAAQAKEAYALGKLEETLKIEGELRAENERQKHINTTLLKEHQRLIDVIEVARAIVSKDGILEADFIRLEAALERVSTEQTPVSPNTAIERCRHMGDTRTEGGMTFCDECSVEVL